MDTATLIIAAILLAICILPFILISRNRKKNEQALLQFLKDEAQKIQCSINEHEFCCNIMIGLDTTKNTIFYLKKGNSGNEYKRVELANFKQCELVKTMQDSTESGVIQKLTLKFIPVSDKVQPAFLEFYNSNERFQLNGELQMIENWYKIILNRIK